MGESQPIRWLSVGMDGVPDHDRWLTAREAAWAARMAYPKRLSEYRLARWCAKTAIVAAGAGLDRADIEIGHLPEGAPAAFIDGIPFPHRISMTDRADWAVCAIAPAGIEVGCDLELVEPRSQAFARDYFTDEERELVFRGGEVDPLVANLVWSAKESALKVLRTGLRRDTRSVEVRPVLGGGSEWLPLTVHTTEGGAFPGWWRRFDEFLLTFAASAPTSIPQSLANPVALASAQPTHRWLTGHQ